MKKEPILLYILRIVLLTGVLFFVAMLYWSSLLVEQDLRVVRAELNSIKKEMDDLQLPSSDTPASAQTLSSKLSSQPASVKERPHIDPKYPNLLEEDPFYSVTLPKMLGPHFPFAGIRQEATVGKPDNLHPFSNWAQVSNWLSMCNLSFARLAFGKYETYTPYMAIKVEARPIDKYGNPEYWIHLRDGVYWHPIEPKLFPEKINLAPQFSEKHQVTAHDFKFYWEAMMNPYVQQPGAVALRTYYDDISDIEVIDDLTLIVRWKTHDFKQENGETIPRIKYVAKSLTGDLHPLASFVYKYFPDGTKILDEDSDPNTYRTNSVWAQNFNQHWARNIIVSCGPWIFGGMSERQIQFEKNKNHFFPYDVLVEGMVEQFKSTGEAIWQDFKANLIDEYTLPPDQLAEFGEFIKSDFYKQQKSESENNGVERLDYIMRAYAYIGWNLTKPYFTSKKVRQALTMAIDRRRIINQNLNGMGIEITGPFFINSPSYNRDITPWPYDIQLAKRNLEEEGWLDLDGEGFRSKMINGKKVPFKFTLTYYVKNATTKSICEYISTALKEVGVICNINGVDIADLSALFDAKSFDAYYLAWALGTPPEDPKQLWYSRMAKEKGSSNAVGFINEEADRIIDRLQFENEPEKRLQLYHRFHAIIFDEQPYTFLYTPKTALVHREYLQNVFIPAERQDLIPGANVTEPDSRIYWLKKKS